MALLFGFTLSSPDSFFNILIMALCLGVMLVPILIRWHELLLVATWNMPVSLFFFPGQPQLWMLVTLGSVMVLALSGGLSRNMDPTATPLRHSLTKSVSWSLVSIAGIIFFTAAMRGGIGGSVFGSEIYGAKKYLPPLFGILGFFLLSRARFLPEQKRLLIILFFGGYLLLSVSNLAYMAGPSFYWLFYFFPADFASAQAIADQSAGGIARISGVAFATTGVIYYMLAHYGLKDTLSIRHWPRFLVFMLAIGVATLGGFRSLIAFFILICLFQFYFEGLFRTPLFPLTLVLGTVLLVGSAAFLNRMPLSVQRTLSFLPVEVDPVARNNAKDSAEWRFRMWSVLWDEVPKYLVVGKGYRIDPAELALFDWARATHRGHFEDYEEQMAVGNYHSGPFSVLLSFGVVGVLAVIWFWCAALRMLYNNMTRGSPHLKTLNIALLSLFAARVVFFLLVFGDLSTDLPTWCGILGLSAAFNKAD